MRKRARGTLLAAFAAALLPGCNQEYANPFEGGNTSVRIPAGADIVFTSNMHGTAPDAPREVYAVEDTGANVTRLTTCTAGPVPCDTLEAAVAPDRMRVAVRRGAPEESALLLLDLARRVEGGLLDTNARVSAVDWSSQEVIVYSAAGANAVEDLYRMDPNGQNNRNLSASSAIRERRPRVDAAGSQAVYERVEATLGVGQIWIFISSVTQARVTSGGARGAQMPGTPYFEGSDADPDYSPDARQVVFRRLTRATADRQGEWDIMTVRADGAELRTVVTGPLWRGPADWGPNGFVFTEVEGGQRRLVVVDAQGANRRVILTVPAARSLDYPRWLQ
jgi:Tol biopolymer transport system component